MVILSTVGVIAEFNPFHNAHQTLLNRIRDDGGDTIVCIMSGNFVQRGEVALLPVSYRAQMALRCGADLCILLPLPWAMSSAQNFADGGISLMQDIGVIDTVAFGSECGQISPLLDCASILGSPSLHDICRQFLRQGYSYAKARSLALKEMAGDSFAELLAQPNNTLAVSYLCAMQKFGFSASARAYPRTGAAHDAPTPSQGGVSASFLRGKIRDGQVKNCESWMPPAAFQILTQAVDEGAIANGARLEGAILSKLRTLSCADFARLPDISEGLENRMFQAAQNATNISELLHQIKSKRYSHARIRRLILSAFLGIDSRYFGAKVPYLRVLGFNEQGAELLRRIAKVSTLPILVRKRDADALSEASRALFSLEASASDQYALALKKPLPCGAEFTFRPIKY